MTTQNASCGDITAIQCQVLKPDKSLQTAVRGSGWAGRLFIANGFCTGAALPAILSLLLLSGGLHHSLTARQWPANNALQVPQDVPGHRDAQMGNHYASYLEALTTQSQEIQSTSSVIPLLGTFWETSHGFHCHFKFGEWLCARGGGPCIVNLPTIWKCSWSLHYTFFFTR